MAHVSALEFFVKSFIRTHRRKSVKTSAIQDSIDLIDVKLSKAEGTQLVIPIGSINILTNAVLGYLNTMGKHQFIDSINRTRQLLVAYKG
jgi:hypothetical protein